MRYLLINNNNSRTKFALADSQRLFAERAAVETATLDPHILQRVTAPWEFDVVVLASVVPTKARLIRAHWKALPMLEITSDLDLGVALDFPSPETIGADRLANAAAVTLLLQASPAIVVDFGTAVTFDILSKEGAYVGGIIAPGLSAMTDYMHERTALLPRIVIEEPQELIGKSTESAMLSGAVYGYRGLVTGILKQLQIELMGEKRGVKTVATGGYAELISRELPEIEQVLPDLTLEGMRLIANRNLD